MNPINFTEMSYPDHNVPDSVKNTKEFGLKMVEYMYGRHYTYRNSYLNWRDNWERNYLYMEGRQSESIYKDQFRLNKGDGGEDESFMNVNWQILPILPKFRDQMVSMITKRTTKVVCNAVNPLAETEKDKKIFKMLAQVALAPEIEKAMELGVEVDVEPEVPETPEDLELYIMSGNLKLAEEMAAELGIELVMGDDKWLKMMPQLIDDVMCTGRATVRKYEDAQGRLQVEAVRPQECLYDFTTKQDYSNVRWGGTFKFMTANEFRQFASGEIPEHEISELITTYKGTTDRYWVYNGPNNYAYNGSDQDQYIAVLDFWFFGTNKLVAEKKQTKYGDKAVILRDEKWNPPAESKYKKEKLEKEYEVVYRGFWVVGSQTVLRYGLETNMGRNLGKYRAYPPMVTYIHQNRDGYPMPFSERVIPAADLIQVNWLKFQNLVAKEPPPGLAIDATTVLNVANGKGGAYKLTDLIQIYTQTGNYYYNPIDPVTGERIQGYPITPINTSYAPAMAQALQNIQTNIDLIRQIFGFNDITDGTTPNPKTLVGVGEMAVQATNNAIWPIQNGLGLLKIMTAQSVLPSIKAIVRKRPYGGYMRDAIGAGSRYLELPESLRNFDYEVELEELMTDEQRAEINRMIDIQLSVRQQQGGVGGIELEDAFAIRRCKTLKQAELLLVSRKRKREVEDQKKQMANIQAQTQSTVQSSQATAEMAMQQKQMEMEFEMQKVAMTQKEERKSLLLNHELKMKQLAMELQIKTAVASITGEYGVEKAEVMAEAQTYGAELNAEKAEKMAKKRAEKSTPVSKT